MNDRETEDLRESSRLGRGSGGKREGALGGGGERGWDL